MPTCARGAQAHRGFLASGAFVGRKPGFVYRKASAGLGYYADGNSVQPKSRDTSSPEKTHVQPMPTQARDASLDFLASEAFIGNKPGRVYTQAAAGLGYYADLKPASTFSGRKPGYAFKSGPQGLGYYCC